MHRAGRLRPPHGQLSPGRCGSAAHKSIDLFAVLLGALNLRPWVMAVVPAAAVEDQCRGRDNGLGRSANLHNVRQQVQRLAAPRRRYG